MTPRKKPEPHPAPWLLTAKTLTSTEPHPARAAAIVAWRGAGGSEKAMRIVRKLHVFHAAKLTIAEWTAMLVDADAGKFERREGFDPELDVVRPPKSPILNRQSKPPGSSKPAYNMRCTQVYWCTSTGLCNIPFCAEGGAGGETRETSVIKASHWRVDRFTRFRSATFG